MCKDNGGYYAIKGFLYQFDKSMIELLKNDIDTSIHIERIQDINYEDYVIQVKHKEKTEYSNSKIRDPIIQLLDIYSKDNRKKLCLYGHFKDKKPSTIRFSNVEQLNKILIYRDADKNKELEVRFPQDLRKGFISNFTLCFGEDFESQFKYLIERIMNFFHITNKDDAIIYHSLIRDKLFELAIKPNEKDRHITGREIKGYIDDCNNKIFFGFYDSVLGRDKYIKLVKKSFFTIKTTNLNRFERLFVIDCSNKYDETVIRKIIDNIRTKYHKRDKSPAPYICFRGINNKILTNVKREMFSDGIRFSDGTYFDGDVFRINRLKEDGDKNGIEVKIVLEENINEVISRVTFKEYHLFIDSPFTFNTVYSEIKVQINDITEVYKMIS